MDVLYLYKNFRFGEEIRLSLRTLEENIPHDKVFIAGETHDWMTNIIHVDNPQNKSRHKNTLTSLLMALGRPDLSDDFILMHDDMFILRPFTSLPVFNRGPLDEVIRNKDRGDPYTQRMIRVRGYLEKKYPDQGLFSYEIHTPMLFNKKDLLNTITGVLEDYPNWYEMQYRTIYGNAFQIGGQTIEDPKLERYAAIPKNPVFLSSGMFTSKAIESVLSERFDRPSKYERIS